MDVKGGKQAVKPHLSEDDAKQVALEAMVQGCQCQEGLLLTDC